MFSKKAIWLGLVAVATIVPILVAQPLLTPGPEVKKPAPAKEWETTADDERIIPLAAVEDSAIAAPMAAPKEAPPEPDRGAVSRLPGRPGTLFPGILLSGGEKQPKEEKKDQTPIPEPPAPATPTPLFALLPSVATTAPGGQPSPAPATNISGQPAVPNTGVGNLLAESNSAQGVEVQKRSPLVGDPRIEGLHFGQIVTQADGGYWFPARIDLDSVVSKLDSSDILNILIVRGPYSVRYGPGFSFLDVESLPTPRSSSGLFEAHGSSAGTYRTNGPGWQGMQSFWGGNAHWGFRISYDAAAAGDYTTGDGSKVPSRYNNQYVNFALGIDLSPTSTLDVRYLHVQQTGVLIPGLLTGVNSLTTDAFTGRYTAWDGFCYDKFVLDVWLNNTSFSGDSANPATRAQIPQLNAIFTVPVPPQNRDDNGSPGGGGSGNGGTTFFPVRLDINDVGYALSYGAREITTWGDPKGFNVSLGADIRVFSNTYNEFDAFNLSVVNNTGLPANLGIPYARQIDPGILLDSTIPVGDAWLFKVGSRVDFLTNQFISFGPNVDIDTYKAIVGDPTDRAYFLFAAYATGEYKLTDTWSAQGGYGYAQRPPTLTELYSGGAFFGLIQNGLNSIFGNTALRKEEMHHLNVGLSGKYDNFRTGANAFYAFVPNYITYRPLGPFTVNLGDLGVGTTPIQQLQFINTHLATLYGFTAYGEADATRWLTPFATLTYVQGWDQFQNLPLPGIPPLASRVGMRFHEDSQNPRWGLEYFARMVATQDLFAFNLGELRTGGFVTHNVRGYWQANENLLLLAGVENIGDLFYREHLDLRTGFSVFQPGVNFYVGAKLVY